MIDGRGADAADASGPTLTVAAVARRLGVAPATLRTWARRYGLGPTDHTAGSHRRYSVNDLARLVVMRRLTHEGVSPAQAAQMALADDAIAPDVTSASSDVDTGPLGLGGLQGPDPDRPGIASARSGGGRVVALPQASPAVRGLARASMALDAYGVSEVLRRAVRTDGVVATWDSLAVPVLVGLGERFAATQEGVEVEHLFSECLIGVLRATTETLAQPGNAVPVLLACVGEEQHSLPLYAVAAALAERGVLARQLGMRVPAPALVSAVRRIGPGIVVLFAAMPRQSLDPLAALSRMRPTPRVLVGGPGWPRDLPAPVTRVGSLAQVVDHVVASAL